MPSSPVDAAADHSEDFEQLAGLAALDALEGDDLTTFRAHEAHCERCRLTVRMDRQTLGHLALAAEPMDASPDFKTRLMQRAAAELAEPHQAAPIEAVAPAPPEPIPLRTRPANVVPFYRRAWASGIAAVLVLGIAAAGVLQYLNQPVATYALSGSTPGTAQVVVRRNGSIELELSGVPDPPPGRVYEAWIIPPGQQPVAAGTTSRGSATLPLAGQARGSTVAITDELAPGVQAPSSAPILATSVQS
jgi:anti-sigma-K factor RskA